MANDTNIDYMDALIAAQETRYCPDCEQEKCRICNRCPSCDGCDEAEEQTAKFDDGFNDAEYERFLDSLVDERAEEEYWELRFRELQINPSEEF